jgi:serine/threonine protein kinase
MTEPTPFGKYLLLERIRWGGMAEIWRACPREGADGIVAIKRLLPRLAADPELLAMFINEARIAVQLAHPNIAQVFDLGRVGDDFYIAMEYVAGTDLRLVFQRSAGGGAIMPIPLAAFVVAQLCDALDYAHRKTDAAGVPLQLVHRDVSPDNCLVTFDGGVKLIDFGVAKITTPAPQTQAGVLKGKFSYMSPEQILGQPLDRRADVFGLAVVLYEMVVGRRLFTAGTELATLQAICYSDVTPPTGINPHVPLTLEGIVLKGLSRDRDQRFQWASEMGAALRAFLSTLSVQPNAAQLKKYMSVTFADELKLERGRREAWARAQVAEHGPVVLGVALEDDGIEEAPTLQQPLESQPRSLPELPEMVVPDLLFGPTEELPPPMPAPRLVQDAPAMMERAFAELAAAPEAATEPPRPAGAPRAPTNGRIQRRWRRWPVCNSVNGRWWKTGTTPVALSGTVYWLSQGGAMLRTQEQVPANVLVELTVPMGWLKKVAVRGVVRWWHRTGDEREIGIEFEQTRPELLKVARPQEERD